jgi:hypothetical protein
MKSFILLLAVISLGMAGCTDHPRYVVADLEDRELERRSAAPYQPVDGYVPDPETAVRIAEAVLERAFGDEVMADQRPLRVMLQNDLWIITGSMPEHAAGGVAYIEISKRDGRIIHVTHGE